MLVPATRIKTRYSVTSPQKPHSLIDQLLIIFFFWFLHKLKTTADMSLFTKHVAQNKYLKPPRQNYFIEKEPVMFRTAAAAKWSRQSHLKRNKNKNEQVL